MKTLLQAVTVAACVPLACHAAESVCSCAIAHLANNIAFEIMASPCTIACRYDNLDSLLATLLGGTVRLFVPSCVMRELKQLAKEDSAFKPTVALARKFVPHQDESRPSMSSTEALLQEVGVPLIARSRLLLFSEHMRSSDARAADFDLDTGAT